MRIDGELCDLSEELALDENEDFHIEVVIDRFVIRGDLQKQVLASIEHGLVVGENFLSFHLLNPQFAAAQEVAAFYEGFGCPEHRLSMAELTQGYFTFNEPLSACVTCSGLEPIYRSIPICWCPIRAGVLSTGAFVREAFNYDRNGWGGRIFYSLAQHYGFDLDAPFAELSDRVVDVLFYGTKGKRFAIVLPPGATEGRRYKGRKVSFDGIINQIDRRYRRYRRQGVAHSGMEDYLRNGHGRVRLPGLRRHAPQSHAPARHRGRPHHPRPVRDAPARTARFSPRRSHARAKEAGRRADRARARVAARPHHGHWLGLSQPHPPGGDPLRRRGPAHSPFHPDRLGLMGMLYVLDEPSIGLHPKDNVKMIETLRRLRDVGNTVIVVEHDEETIRAADHIIELGPGPGVHGGRIAAEGTIRQILKDPNSLTGQFLTGRQRISLPPERRPLNGCSLRVCGARANNLDDLDVKIPLGVFVCVSGASGSGKSTLVHDILYKKLYSIFHDSRVLSGAHDHLDGIEHISDVINIDQSPIGRSPRSNPATYIGFYDNIRRLFAQTPEAEKRGYTASRFSFNVKGGRCEECGGEGTVTTKLHLMADVEVPCPTCKGARYNQDTLDVTYQGKNIAEVLAMTIEEGVDFFADQRLIAHKLGVLDDLGLGYLQIGHPAPLLSGGEAQRVKLADELGKLKRGKSNLYLLDEPTTGLHLADIQRLLDSLEPPSRGRSYGLGHRASPRCHQDCGLHH